METKKKPVTGRDLKRKPLKQETEELLNRQQRFHINK
jgi:hypothetical protein